MSIVPLLAAGLNFLGKRSEAKAQNRLEMAKYKNLRKAAEAGGFHPLAVLQAGGSVNMQAGPRLLTSLSASNAFDALEDEYTGEAEKQRKRVQVEDEIRELERERLKYEVASSMRTRPTIGTIGTMDEGGTRNGGPGQRPEQRPGYWSGDTIPVVGPTNDVLRMPVRLAERLGLKQWDPLIADDMEGLAGDEVSQAMFADWLVSNGLKVRGGNEDGKEIYTTGDLWDSITSRLPRIQSEITKPKGWRGVNN